MYSQGDDAHIEACRPGKGWDGVTIVRDFNGKKLNRRNHTHPGTHTWQSQIVCDRGISRTFVHRLTTYIYL
jgi:hypothetical protein